MTRFDDIQARHAKATPGPWKAIKDEDDEELAWILALAEDLPVTYITPRPWRPGDEGMQDADAEFIAHCPDDVRWLLDRVTQIETALTKLSGWDAVDTLELGEWRAFARAALDTEQPSPGDTPFGMPPMEEIEKPLLRPWEQP